MKARQLIEVLKKYPNSEVNVAWEEQVQYSELTSSSEDQVEEVRAVYLDGPKIILSAECYIAANKIWPDSREDKIQPNWTNGVPFCTSNCPLNDGKRCEKLGYRAPHYCEPAITEMWHHWVAIRRDTDDK